MARSSITYEPLSGIAMRFPQYPLDLFLRCLDNEEEMLKVFRNNGFKNAILFSSPALYKEYKRWLSGEMTGEKDKLKVKLSLLKYFARMSSRCTPFASLASCGYVNWGNSQQIRPDEKIVERFRLDMLYCCMISQQMLQDKSIREILSDEEAQKNYYLRGIEYRNRIISMYKKGLEDIEAYLNEHASEHDGYQIRLDVSEIIRDVEKAVDKAGEL